MAAGLVDRLVGEACRLFGVVEDDLRGDSRQREIVSARRALTKVLVEQVGWSYPRVGQLLCKDHSTCIYAHSRANDCYRGDPIFHEAVTRLEQEITR